MIPWDVIPGSGGCSGIPPASRECFSCVSRMTFPWQWLICAGCGCDSGAAPHITAQAHWARGALGSRWHFGSGQRWCLMAAWPFCLTFINPRNPADCKSVREIFLADPSQSQCPGVVPQTAEKSCRQCLYVNPSFGCFRSSAALPILVCKCGAPSTGSSRNFCTFFICL